ncbi:anti-sigma factor [Kaistia dalseonensis]|uniref:Regulator of SigK n=1 Tax=Kaistia dalseonensis TaxID=410840 RepID=A0ABU0HD28_9HYPH|nr:anti-sigma factor [Kaistia dalseonensis]MCX5497583.1 anti-sigma factor [Kaistia dalseonensis]MDQ0440223.1 anti-sigma-K factor RskA [Kaistia dalseonensis]
MAVDDDIEGLAAEYVLGTLDPSERRDVEARIERDPALAVAVGGWAGRLQPLADLAGEIPPPVSAWKSILARIRDAGEAGRVLVLERTVRRWRLATVGVGIAAAVLAVIVGSDRLVPPPPAPGLSYVAVLNGEAGQPAFVAAVDTGSGTIRLRRIGEAPPPDKSYELWQVPASGPTVSMGVADNLSDLKKLNVSLKDGEKLAISLEPKGGSPTGQATGPIVYVGALLPAE